MNPIGFRTADETTNNTCENVCRAEEKAGIKPSVVRVFFPDRNRTLMYYNDTFDLCVGDIVFVDGKLEGIQGRITGISTNFKVKAEDYRRVISVADTCVTGQFFQADTHFITFHSTVLPWKQFCSWVKPPDADDTEYYIRFDEEGISLHDLKGLDVSRDIFDRGVNYYQTVKVQYLCLHDGKGRAIVAGTKPYEVEFQYQDGLVSNLACDCPCGYTCKHEVAVLLQLRETLERIEKDYAAQWKASGCFAIVDKSMFYNFAINANPDVVLELY